MLKVHIYKYILYKLINLVQLMLKSDLLRLGEYRNNKASYKIFTLF